MLLPPVHRQGAGDDLPHVGVELPAGDQGPFVGGVRQHLRHGGAFGLTERHRRGPLPTGRLTLNGLRVLRDLGDLVAETHWQRQSRRR